MLKPYHPLKGWKQIVFTIGHIGPGMLNQFITTWLLVFLAPSDGDVVLKSSLVGMALMSGRLIDAIADPLVAYLSDNIRSKRFGRRLPFIMVGAIPMVLSFNMLWFTQAISSVVWVRFLWILVSVNLFYFSYTVVVNPYFALLPEIAHDNKQRMYIQSFQAFFGILGMGIAMGASGFLIDAMGFQSAGLLLSVLCVLSLIGPVVTVKVNADYPVAQPTTKALSLWQSVRSAMENKSFRTYIMGFSIFFLGFQLIQYNMVFITTILLQLERSMSSVLFIFSVISALLFIPVYNKIVAKKGATGALKIAILAYVGVSLLIALLPGLTKIMNPTLLGFVMMLFLGFPYSGLMVIPNVLVSQIIDQDVVENNVRREALFFGVQGLINKFMVSLSALIVGVVLDVFGNSIQNPMGVILIGPLAAVAAIVGYILIQKLEVETQEESEVKHVVG